MITIAANGSIVSNRADDLIPNQGNMSITLPADLVAEQADVIDRVFDFVFTSCW